MTSRTRCAWVTDDPDYITYHDTEWGRPVRDERQLFEMLTLEGAQAGLSWLTVLKRREGYRAAFAQFNIERVASFDAKRAAALREDARIIRNRLKIESTVSNAQAILALHEQGSSLSALLWDCVDGEAQVNHWRSLREVPASTPTSDALAKRLKQHGFRFVGSTICYALMQAVGIVNDHTTDCWCHPDNQP